METWQPCRVDPFQGIAFFDGIFLQADSLNDSRWDRVIPIFQEEQVFVSRILRKRLKRGLRVLDVGTGCGVYAIIAAKEGCTVLALDNSERACMFARHNAAQNGISLATDPVETQPGQLCVMHEDVNTIGNLGLFDVVILSPGYNPTHPELERIVAAHAAAGEIGEKGFRQQIKRIPELLNIGGLCIGNQLTAVRSLPQLNHLTDSPLTNSVPPEELLMVQDMSAAFDGALHVVLTPIISRLVSTNQFLRLQYKGLENHIRKLQNWIGDLGTRFPYLALVYYEAKAGESGKLIFEDSPWGSTPEDTAHGRGWEYRIIIHRNVVEHTSERGFTPLPLLLTDGVSTPLLQRRAQKLGNGLLPPDPIYNTNLYSLIDAEIQSRGFGELFTAIILDTTPIYPLEEGVRKLENQNRIWLDGDAEFGNDKRKAEVAEALLSEWLQTVTALQRAKCGPFAHPWFCSITGDFDWRWPEILTTEYPTKLDEDLRAAKDIVDMELLPALNQVSSDVRAELHGIHGYSRTTIGALDMKDYESNVTQSEIRIRQLEAALNSPGKTRKDRQVIAQIDLRACQIAMHEVLHRRFLSVIQSLGITASGVTSMLSGTPLGMLFYRTPQRYEGFAPYYKGVLWIFLMPKGEWGLRHEDAAQHLLRVAWLIFSGSYGALSERALMRLERDAIWKYVSFSAAHRIGNPVFAIETYLDSLRDIIKDGDTKVALDVMQRISYCVDTAKLIVDQFKSLTRAQQIQPIPMSLKPLLDNACANVKGYGVQGEVHCAPDTIVMGDPARLSESFDELAMNATYWFDKPTKLITIRVSGAPHAEIPKALDTTKGYVIVRFQDNGAGVPKERKSKIFDAFATTREDGTGLGLAMVQRVIDGHGGTIREVGTLGEGAQFEIYLPIPSTETVDPNNMT